VKNFDWNVDKISDVEARLNAAQKLWNMQTFLKPTQKRRIEILSLFNQTVTDLESIITELEE